MDKQIKNQVFESINKRSVLWIIACATIVMAPHFPHLPLWISSMAVICLLSRYVFHQQLAGKRVKWLVSIIAVLYALAILSYYHTLFGRDEGVALLVMMLALKVVEMKNVRDAFFILLLNYFVIITNFFFTQDLPIVAYMLLAVLINTLTLLELNHPYSAASLTSRLQYVAVLLIQSVPVMLILFVLFPRISGPLWALPKDATAGVTGLSNEMSPGKISKLIHSDAVAFRVRFEGEIPPMQLRYWRGPVMWHFDGRTWRPRMEIIQSKIDYSATGMPVNYSVTLEPHNERWLFALDIPATVPDNVTVTRDFQLLSVTPLRGLTSYKMSSYTNFQIGRTLPEFERQIALRLPIYGSPRARKLAASWREEAGGDEDVVKSALQYFHQQPFHYTLQPPLLMADPVDQFLFETKRGFCEHYASSFTVLMRAAGIPARVVTGYMGGEWNPIGNYMLVRQADAHAWTEVWLAERGWVRIDPIAAVSPERIEAGISAALSSEDPLPMFIRASYGGSWLNQVELAWDLLTFQWNEWVVSFGPEQQRQLLARLGFFEAKWQILAVLMVLTLAIVLAGYSVVFLWLNRNTEQDLVVKLYRQLCAKFGRIGLTRYMHEGPVDYAARIVGTRPDLNKQVAELFSLYTEIRYASRSQPENISRFHKLIKMLSVSPMPREKPA